jgi:sulfopropanediol 3-dehydrogenase
VRRTPLITYLKEARRKPGRDLRAVSETVSEILDRVRREGEAAVRYYSEKFDNWDPPSFRVSGEEIEQARGSLSDLVRQDIDFCQEQIRNFAQSQRDSMTDFEIETLPGVHLGQRILPVGASGSYVPGGRYPLLASAHMTVITPRVAGVDRVVACSPPTNGQGMHAGTLYSMAAAGADEIYCLGGVQALAAMAFGMEGLEPVDMIVGAGNVYVAEAKRQLFGTVGIDLLAGPTEILVLVDDTSDAAIVAADVLGQAEHDPDSRQALVSLSRETMGKVLMELEDQLKNLPTRQVAEASWRHNGEAILVDSAEEAVEVCDSWAPEHLEVHTANWRYYLDALRNYGSLFLGEETTVAYGDKCIGTNHVLPTMRAARYTGGLSVGKFLRVVTYQYMERDASAQLAPLCERACTYERMLAHGLSCRVRTEKYGARI